VKVKPMTVILVCLVPEAIANQGTKQAVADTLAEAMTLRHGPKGILLQETLITYKSPLDPIGGGEA
jgi:hypothetical protein